MAADLPGILACMQPGQALDYGFAGARDNADALPERMRFWFGGQG